MVGMEIGNTAEWVSIAWSVLSGIFMLISWYQSTGSKKARAEADAAVARAEIQARAAQAEAYEARRQTEAMQSLVESLKEQVTTAEKSVEQARVLNETMTERVAVAKAAATDAKRLTDSAEKQASQVEKIAASLQAPLFKVSKTEQSRYVLTYTGDTAVTVSVENIDEFLRLDGLNQGMELAPGESVQFSVLGSSQSQLPDELVLNVSGHATPVRVPLTVGG